MITVTAHVATQAECGVAETLRRANLTRATPCRNHHVESYDT